MTGKRLLKKSLKVLLWIFVSIVGLLVIAILILQIPSVQTNLAGKAAAYLSKKTGAEVSVGQLSVKFPKSLFLGDILIKDQKHDTLWYSHSIKADVAMWGLFHKKIQVNSLSLEKATAHVSRRLPDSAFNFDFIVNAFADTAQEEVKPAEDTSRPGWAFSILGVELDDGNLTYKDAVSGMDAVTKIGHFETDLNDFDLEKKHFGIKDVELSKSFGHIVQWKAVPADTAASQPMAYAVDLKKAALNDVDFSYADKSKGTFFSGKIGDLQVLVDKLDLTHNTMDLRSVKLNNSEGVMRTDKVINADTVAKAAKNVVEAGPKEQAGEGWRLSADEVKMAGNAFRLDDNNIREQPGGIDYNHMLISDIAALIKDLSYTTNRTVADVEDFSLKEKSGLLVKKFTSRVTYDSVHAELADLVLETNASNLTDHLEISYPSIEALSADPGRIGIHANLKQSTVGFQDVLLFAPQLRSQPPFVKMPYGNAVLNTHLEGLLSDLDVQEFRLWTGTSTVVNAHGHITGLPDMDKAHFDLDIPQVSTTSGDMYAMLPATYIPSSIRLPSYVNASAVFRGSMNNFSSAFKMNSALGNAIGSVKMTKAAGAQKYAYETGINIPSFQLGRLLKQDSTLGKFTGQIYAKGAGFDPNVMNTYVKADIKRVDIMQYPYTNFKTEGNIRNGLYTGKASMNDTNIAFTYDGTVGIVPEKTIYKFNLNLEGADLQHLKLTDKDLRVKGTLNADMRGSNLNNINGNLNIHDVMFVKDDRQYPINSLAFVSIVDKGNTDISVNSDFLKGHFKGTINLGDLPAAMEAHMDKYFTYRTHKDTGVLKTQNFDFSLDLYRTDLITDIFYPDLQRIIPGVIRGHYNSEQRDLTVEIKIPQVVYLGIEVDTLAVDVKSDEQKLNYGVKFARVKYQDMNVINAALTGRIQNDSIITEFGVKDKEGKQKYLLAGNLKSADNIYMLRLREDGVIFNYEQWNVPSDNFVRFDRGIVAHNVRMENGGKSVALQSKTETTGSSPLVATFRQFDLLYLTSFVEGDKYPVSGSLDGTLELRNLQAAPAFTTDININTFAIKKNEVGDVHIIADNLTAGTYALQLELTGNNNAVRVAGHYTPLSTTEAVNFKAYMGDLNLHTLEPFMMGQLRELSGTASGTLVMKGSTDAPVITGTLHFTESGFTLGYLNTHYTLHDEMVTFDGQGMSFNGFTVSDSANNTAEVNGYVYAKYFKEFKLSLDLRTQDFLALNSQPTKDADYYGKLVVSSRAKITGTPLHPRIDVRASLEDGTDFTFVLPADDPSIEERDGVVEFVNLTNPPNEIVFQKKLGDTTAQLEVTGLTLESNIDVDEKAKLKIILDKESGDFLDVRGKAVLSYGIDEGGNMSLTGRYEIQEGTYELSLFNFVHRKFEIKQGSTITWLGAPMSADLDVTAIYEIKTSSLALMEQEVAGLDDAERTKYKQRLPFQVEMHMTGHMDKPTINLDIDLPEDQRAALGGTVNNKLAQLREDQGEVNKQVFALLTVGSFVREDPFSKSPDGSSGGINSAVASSVSELLSQQLNTLAGKYLKDVELNFDIENYDDYSTGAAQNRTDVNIGLQKEFLNDRVTVNVGTDVNVEGDQETGLTTSHTSEIVSDLTIEYKLTKDGRLRIMLFRNNEYAGVIEGQLTETGTGLIFVRDFNRFRQLFRKPRDQEERLKKDRS